MTQSDQERIEKLEKELINTKLVLSTLIAWSQNNLGVAACTRLINELQADVK